MEEEVAVSEGWQEIILGHRGFLEAADLLNVPFDFFLYKQGPTPQTWKNTLSR